MIHRIRVRQGINTTVQALMKITITMMKRLKALKLHLSRHEAEAQSLQSYLICGIKRKLSAVTAILSSEPSLKLLVMLNNCQFQNCLTKNYQQDCAARPRFSAANLSLTGLALLSPRAQHTTQALSFPEARVTSCMSITKSWAPS